ncbi:hypothetical protein G7Z17_g2906 [Cylindrodendrum hubeiense]|uniref:NACHT domain-containing protein n=1 Tax=Cylindrodendrum hubeiense TaxID=595255 RepID=A0A9P5HM79_9HYPO|nr:hypothetical protein G7Z17_g2906 [Cylindrodendrum hubeiense]
MAPHLFHNLRSKIKGSREATSPDPTPEPPTKPSRSLSPPAPPPLQPASPQAQISPQSLQERLWNEAYDDLKSNESDVVETYEKILSSQLHAGDSAPASQKNEIGQTKEERSNQMKELVRLGLEKNAKITSAKQGIEGVLQPATIVKAIVDKAVQASPEASVAWVGVCFALDILSNPITEAGINRRGLSYVVTRMDWYWNLAGLLLDENRSASSSAGLRDELEKHIIQLYKKLLLYQMKSICIYHRNQAMVFLRDMFKLDDWSGQLTDITDAEVAVRKDSQQFNTEQIKSHLQVIAEAAASQESKLEDIHSVLLAQTVQQTKFQEQQTKFQEQQAKIRKDDNFNKCLHDLRETDPRDNKTRIQESKGGLLKDSYSWILDHADFKRWRSEPESRLLWIKGDPGKGKTMLLCGIIDELEKEQTHAMSYFFCQATEPTLRSATAVLRGIVYLLIDQMPSLISYVPKKYAHVGKQLFEDEAAWGVLSKMLTTMLDDPILDGATLIIDGLDECVTGLLELLVFIGQISSSASAKWVLSSRNWASIEDKLDNIENVKLSLELNESSVSRAVRTFIEHKVAQLSREKKYDDKIRQGVLDYLVAHSDDTFLWAALVCRELGDAKVRKWHTLAKLRTFPAGLDALYNRMMEQISDSLDADRCKEILATVSTTYRPITLKELTFLAESVRDFQDDIDMLKELIGCCGSFLNIREDSIYFIHQSAKDFLLNQASSQILPSGIGGQHHAIFLRSLEALSEILQRDIYDLQELGTLIDDVSTPEPDPLGASAYACVYWVDHLEASDSPENLKTGEDLEDEGTVYVYLREKYLYWLEALSLLHSLSRGIKAVEKLDAIVGSMGSGQLPMLVRDAQRFLLSHKQTIETAPLQLYASALIFSPSGSLIREFFEHESPEWILSKPNMEESWDARLQVIEAHVGYINAVTFSQQFQQLATCSSDRTIKIWELSTGNCLNVLKGHTGSVTQVVFSPFKDTQALASSAYDHTVKIWDTEHGNCLLTLEGHTDVVTTVAFSKDGRQLASGSYDETVKIWNAVTGACLRTLEGHTSTVNSVAYSLGQSVQQLASGSTDGQIKIWDPARGTCLKTLEGHGACLLTLEGHIFPLLSLVFTADNQQLASSAGDGMVKIWDVESGKCLQTISSERVVTQLWFDPAGKSRLHSDLGTLDLNLPTSIDPQMIEEVIEEDPSYSGYGLCEDRAWITKDEKRVLWLPSEYRSSKYALRGETIAIGCSSGRVLAMEFSAAGPAV